MNATITCRALLCAAVLAALTSTPASAQPSCTALATNSAYGLAGNPSVTGLTATPVSVSGGLTYQPGMGTRSQPQIATTVAYCRVDFTFNSGKSGPLDGYAAGQAQAIGIRVGLPLRSDDGGAGAWNGKIHNLGSSGCMGFLGPVTAATNAGYAGAVSDGGHRSPFAPETGRPETGLDCKFGLNESGTLNVGLIRDFSAEHLRWQTLWSKQLARTYYGREPRRTYWSGCSQGGREAHIIAQTIPHEYDGVLGGGAGLWWMRFSVAHAWAGLVIKDMLTPKGKTLTPAQIAATTDAAIDSCDAKDGVKDGVLADPRACT
jgi:hypothetical protein